MNWLDRIPPEFKEKQHEKKWFSRAGFFIFLLMLCIQPSWAGDSDSESDGMRVDRRHIKVVVAADGSSVIEQYEVTSLLTPNGVNWGGEEKLSFSAQRARAEVLEAFTELPDGSRLQVQSNAIRLVQDDEAGQSGGYSDGQAYVVIFPRLTVGAKTHLRTRVNEHTPLIEGQFFHGFRFPRTMAFREVVVDLEHDPLILLHIDTSGEQSGLVTQKLPVGADGLIRYRFTLNDTHAIKAESSTVNLSDVSPYIHFSTLPDMIAFGQQYQARSAKQEEVTPAVKALADQITQGITDPMEQVRAIRNWISREIRYVAVLLGDGAVFPNHVDDILRNRYGDCKDHNTLLISLLAAKGIEAESALINLGRSYTLPNLGVLGQINHVITYLPRWDLYIDATDHLSPVGLLPYEVADKPTVLTKQGKIARTPRTNASHNRVTAKVSMRIQPDGQIVGDTQAAYIGPISIRARDLLSQYDGRDKQRVVENQLSRVGHVGKGAFQMASMRDLDNPVEFMASFEIEPVTNFPGPGAIMVPAGLAPGRIVSLAGAKPQPDHKLPFNCLSYSFLDHYTLVFPDTVRVTRLPTAHQFQQEGYAYRSSYRQDGQTVFVEREVVVERPRSVCVPGEQAPFNTMLKMIQRDLRGQIFYE